MSFIGTGIAIGNIAGALSASLGSALGIGALGSISAGAGGIGALTAGSVLAGTAGTGLGALAGAAEGAAGATAATAAPEVAAPTIATSSTGGIAPGSVISAMGGPGAIPAGAVPASSGSGITSSMIAAPGGAIATPSATTMTAGGFTGFGHLGDFAAKEIATNAVMKGGQGISQEIANAQTEEDSDKVKQQFGGWAHGGEIQHVARHGGSIRLRNGDFVIPADVVSALGNGSSKAGAKYLTHLFKAIEAGPAPRAGALAKQRAQARRSA